jgi:hypothetical protein
MQKQQRRAIHVLLSPYYLIWMVIAFTTMISKQGVVCQETFAEAAATTEARRTATSTEEEARKNDTPVDNSDDGTEEKADHHSGETADEKNQTQSSSKLWGAATREEEGPPSGNNKIPFVAKPKGSMQGGTAHATHTTTIHQDPFSKGFHITTRVYTDVHDKKAHFDHDFMEHIVLPYWECGVTGSTTVPIPLQHAQIRHLLGGAKPGSFSVGGGEDNFGPHPQLILPLTPLEIVLNSGQQHVFQPGEVILLENVIAGGHKVLGVDKKEHMICMILTLPNPYHHIGKDKNSLQTIFEKSFWKQNPCMTGLAKTGGGSWEECRDDDVYSWNQSKETSVRSNVLSRWAGPPRAVRRVGLSVIGAGLSLAIADFLGKCAPFILAVAFGGGALVVGGTYGVVKLGEYGIDELEIWHERRLLRLQGGGSSSNNDNVQDYDSEDVDTAVLGQYEEEKKKLDASTSSEGQKDVR